MVFETIAGIIAEQFSVEEDSVTRETAFVDDLGADSLDIVELTMAMEEEFSIPELPEDEMQNILTVGDLVDFVSNYVAD